jgi:isoquinoline 1-oxidoreductase alpha subunit
LRLPAFVRDRVSPGSLRDAVHGLSGYNAVSSDVWAANPMITLKINGENHEFDVDPATPLLWVIREQAGLTGTKFGCGIAQCGSCTVHMNGTAIRSCVTPVRAAAGTEITTIEGIGSAPDRLHVVQQAWIAEQVPQCGYCQSGQIMSAVALLNANPSPTDADIDAAMSGNICRCGTYPRIRKGIKTASILMAGNAEGRDNG